MYKLVFTDRFIKSAKSLDNKIKPKLKSSLDALLAIDSPQDFDPYEFNLEEVYFENPKKRLAEWNKGFGTI